MTEPAALTAAKLYAANGKDIIFLEGILFEFSSTSLSSGSFTKVHTMELGGSNSAFISTASAGVFSTGGACAEQIAVVSGDHVKANNDNMYFDIVWSWANGTSITI